MGGYDAILIPGGGVRAGGELPSWVRSRLDRALDLWSGEFVMPLSAGTPHRPPPLDERGFPIMEAVAQARYLTSRGLPATRLLIEASSLDTIGNAFFSRVLHAEPRALRRLLIITSDFHMPRTEMIFRWVYSLPPGPEPWSLFFDAVPDPQMDPALARERREREQRSMDVLMPLIASIRSFEQFHDWLFSTHGAYSAGGLLRPRPPLEGNVAASY